MGAGFGSFVDGLFSGAKSMTDLRKSADDLQTQLQSNELFREEARRQLAGLDPYGRLPGQPGYSGSANWPNTVRAPDGSLQPAFGSDDYGTGGGGGGGGGGGPTTMLAPGEVGTKIDNYAQYYGVDPMLAKTTAAIESSFGQDPTTNDPNRKYRGVFQLGPDEWHSLGGTDADRNDLEKQINLGVALLAQRKAELARSLGREPEPWEVYLAHNQGVYGATQLLNNPNTPAGQLTNPQYVSANGGNPNAPASSFTGMWRDKFGRFTSRLPQPAAPVTRTALAPVAPATPGAIAPGDEGNPPAPAQTAAAPATALQPTIEGSPVVNAAPAATNAPPIQGTGAPAPAPQGANVNPQGVQTAAWHPYGDSIAMGFIRFGGLDGKGLPGTIGADPGDTEATAAPGRTPQQVLARLKKIPNGGLNGQNVILSTGVSNDPAQIGLVPDQVKELKRAGANRIRVVGVGNRAGPEGGRHYALGKHNATLRQMVHDNGGEWAGELPAVVHPAKDYYRSNYANPPG